MVDWSRDLARSYAACRGSHPEDRVLVVCDLDGTLLERPGTGIGAPRPCRGVVDALRWFHAQPLTSVAVVGDRPESQRDATMAELRSLGREYRMCWDEELLHLHPDEAATDPVAHRVAAFRRGPSCDRNMAPSVGSS